MVSKVTEDSRNFIKAAFYLQNASFSKWAMLGSNQRPPPCKGGLILSQVFNVVQKYLQNGGLVYSGRRTRSRLFAWVGVKLVSTKAVIPF